MKITRDRDCDAMAQIPITLYIKIILELKCHWIINAKEWKLETCASNA